MLRFKILIKKKLFFYAPLLLGNGHKNTQLVETNSQTHERFSDDSEYGCGNNF